MARARVLSVDDDPMVRTFVRVALESTGDYEVTAVAGGAEALALLATGYDPDLILLDMMMPGMDGNEVREALLRRPGRQPPVILLTAYAGEIRSGADLVSVLDKPLSSAVLVSKVAEALQPSTQGRGSTG